jgi:hypothetical protein
MGKCEKKVQTKEIEKEKVEIKQLWGKLQAKKSKKTYRFVGLEG